MNLQSTLSLHNGVKIPRIGLGVYQSAPGEETQQAVKWALEAGYRHIDTAAVYRNERDVGAAIRSSGIARSEIFVTTKLAAADHGFDSALRAFDQSLSLLKLDYVDLYLIHWPGSQKRSDTWKALCRLYDQKRCRAIGVSNYTIKHLQEMVTQQVPLPTVNQVEFSPFLFQRELHELCKKHRIQLEAYSPLTQGIRLSNAKVKSIAAKHSHTPAQVMLRWALQHDIVVIPKSVRRQRIEENAGIFDFSLDAEDLNILDHADEGLRTCWDPTNVA